MNSNPTITYKGREWRFFDGLDPEKLPTPVDLGTGW
jgi:hypothetical protein